MLMPEVPEGLGVMAEDREDAGAALALVLACCRASIVRTEERCPGNKKLRFHRSTGINRKRFSAHGRSAERFLFCSFRSLVSGSRSTGRCGWTSEQRRCLAVWREQLINANERAETQKHHLASSSAIIVLIVNITTQLFLNPQLLQAWNSALPPSPSFSPSLSLFFFLSFSPSRSFFLSLSPSLSQVFSIVKSSKTLLQSDPVKC